MSDYLERARVAFRSARMLIEAGDTVGACNRTYYAMFDAVRAVLSVVRELDIATIKTHQGLARLFELHFVKANLFNRELATTLNEVRELRWAADYGDNPPALQDAQHALNDAIRFVDECERLIITSAKSQRPLRWSTRWISPKLRSRATGSTTSSSSGW